MGSAFALSIRPLDQNSPSQNVRKGRIASRFSKRVSVQMDTQKDEDVTGKKKLWLNTQANKILTSETAETAKNWERVFDTFASQVGKTELTLHEISELFNRFDIRVNRAMLTLLFSLFDANNNGVVDKTEFLVSITFLTEALTAESTVDLAFFLFDTNRSNSVSRSEFAVMCLAMMNKAKFVLAVPFLRQAFRYHLEAERNSENLDFFEKVEKVRKLNQPHLNGRSSFFLLNEGIDLISEKACIKLSDAREIFENFIADTAISQVNLSASNRQAVERILEENKDNPDDTEIDSQVFDSCITEIIYLMETDSMARFKEKIKTDQLWVSDEIWKQEKLKPDDCMDKDQFRTWANKHPGLFVFLEELLATLKKAEKRQKLMAALLIQRYYRRYRAYRKLKAIIDQASPKSNNE